MESLLDRLFLENGEFQRLFYLFDLFFCLYQDTMATLVVFAVDGSREGHLDRSDLGCSWYLGQHDLHVDELVVVVFLP